MLSNKLAMYLYGSIDSSKINYRIFKANIKEAVKDTVCDPNYVVPGSEHGYDEICWKLFKKHWWQIWDYIVKKNINIYK